MQSRIAIQWSFGFLATLLLAACGGGGGGGGGGVATQPIIITSPSPPDGSVNVVYAGFAFSVASGGAAPFSWSETGALPPGLSFNPSGQLSGVPTTAGTYPIEVTVTDSSRQHLMARTSVSLVIVEPGDVIVAAASPPTGTLSYAYANFLFTATGGSPPFAWSATGTLPPGLTLSSDGWLTGTPTGVGTWAFTVVATDSARPPKTGSQVVTVVIESPANVAINSTVTLPAGVHGTPYPSFSFSATGGVQPLHWTATGAVPPGLTVGSDGILSGTPTRAGSFGFTVKVTDSGAVPTLASAVFTVVVTEPPPPAIAAAAPPTGTAGVAYPAFRFSASNGLAPLMWSATGTLAGLEFSLDGILTGTPTVAGHFPVTIDVKDALNQTAAMAATIRVSLARPAAAFSPTGSMTVARSGHTATLLPDGKVLVAGGPNASAELYDPATGMFTATGSMTIERSRHTATLLTDAASPNHGKVLIVGGDAAGMSAELYDPASGTFTATGGLAVAHRSHTATLLATGKVLVAGGGTATTELYDPASGTFTTTGSMTIARTQHTATRLLDGKVLVTGGGTETAETYDPLSRTFTSTGSMNEARTGATATQLQDGTVLVSGPVNTAELFDPATRTFARVGDPLHGAAGAAASLLMDGTVLVAGGSRATFVVKQSCHLNGCTWVSDGVAYVSLTSADIFAPESLGFTLTGSLGTARDGHTATLLNDGAVLITGGTQHSVRRTYYHGFSNVRAPAVVLSSAELYK